MIWLSTPVQRGFGDAIGSPSKMALGHLCVSEAERKQRKQRKPNTDGTSFLVKYEHNNEQTSYLYFHVNDRP